VRVGDRVELLQVAADMRASSGSEAPAHSPLFYQLLRSHGVLGEDTPAAIEMFSGRGRQSTTTADLSIHRAKKPGVCA
jgi:hypothetical protein